MSNNHKESNFSNDFGKTIPIKRRILLSPINHREHGLPSGVYEIGTIDLNEQEFSIKGSWHRMADYHFGAIEPVPTNP